MNLTSITLFMLFGKIIFMDKASGVHYVIRRDAGQIGHFSKIELVWRKVPGPLNYSKGNVHKYFLI